MPGIDPIFIGITWVTKVVAHPSFARNESNWRLRRAFLLVPIVGMGLGMSRYSQPQVAPVVALVGALAVVLILSLLKDAQPYWLGSIGEDRAARSLNELGPEYVLLSNWVPPGRPLGDIDLIILGPFGGLVVEVKTYACLVRCQGDRWQVRGMRSGWRSIKSPSTQLKQNTKVVAAQFTAPVHGVLVFNDQVRLMADSPTVEIIRRKELLRYVQSLPSRGYDGHQLSAMLTHGLDVPCHPHPMNEAA